MIKIGDKAVIVKEEWVGDVIGMVVTVEKIDSSSIPFYVRTDEGQAFWISAKGLEPLIDESSEIQEWLSGV